MPWLNYHHLLYFWQVAKEGSIARASAVLHLTPSTISLQVRQLEEQLGQQLFTRVGKRLVLTESGQIAYRHADSIFAQGRELMTLMAGGSLGAGSPLAVGASDALPKIVTYKLLEPALRLKHAPRLVCDEDKVDLLLANLALHRLDVVLHDAPLPPGLAMSGHSHLLGECSLTVFASPTLARAHRRRFPKSLDGAPFLLPMVGSATRDALETWFRANGIRPDIRAEIHDSAVLKVFGAEGLGLFAGPSAIETSITKQYDVDVVGRIDDVKERYFAITVERRVRHPAVAAIISSARQRLFA